ncbi:MarR family transcriptional regulator [Nitratireductor sp. CAU 1489]|uniref:MarR family transcriptional regulator n=1 Tax=Nitratireductor arenosus TaxID=2682096 RepID=A0A844QGG7_9HYPH|nr:MarR family winged helix-turn-helix transcriptional regulator [Nitratireductor arenosus]MVA98482.1 MarR family transcriptional regulator [Nitratireductor arenosus]
MSKPELLTFATTLEVRDACLCLHVQRAARALARHFDEVLRPYGLSNGQFSLLMALNRPEPPRIKDVAATLAMDRTTLTAALKPLERRGLASSAVDPADRRNRVLRLTESGRATLAAAVPAWRASHAEIERRVPRGDADGLRGALAALSWADSDPATGSGSASAA